MSSNKGNGKLTFVNVGELAKNCAVIMERPSINRTKFFPTAQQDPEVQEFMRCFEEWNISQSRGFLTRVWQQFWEFALAFLKTGPSSGALDAMNEGSYPYIDIQSQLASLTGKYLQPGATILDLGCGRLDFIERLATSAENLEKIGRIFALDLDDRVLRDAVATLCRIGYRKDVALIQAFTSYYLPIWNERIDIVVSSLGATIYSFAWIEGNKKGKEALQEHLNDVHRVLKPGGIFAFSSLKPNPNFWSILSSSLFQPLKHRNVVMPVQTIAYGLTIKTRSRFMSEYAKKGYAHYLHVDEWKELLNAAGFEMLEASEGEAYAGQGVVIIAKKRT